ncbi:hypothetical protein [Polyangium mundeleinium]|uniref:Uncharacterized protein n=1 Tax=Polyangium mundeleinium TaxID=2995306 RepID=A0ABT5F376_9BACT|nr:hypothetical protein [Polyangium mundeleinium]MDC0748550.1 hypothetical protein [Polyangium mundeleinium]
MPDATAERLRACVDEFGGDLRAGHYTFDYKVLADQEGHIADVKAKGVPHADLAACTRLALGAMTVPEDLLKVRRVSGPLAQANGQTMPERGPIGEVVIVTVTTVTIVFVDLLIEAGVATMLFAITLEIAGDVAESLRSKEERQQPCPPCKTVRGKIVPVGTIGYRPLDTPPPGKAQHGVVGPHHNIYKANQNPKICQCFWQSIGAVPSTGLPPGAIPIEPFVN